MKKIFYLLSLLLIFGCSEEYDLTPSDLNTSIEVDSKPAPTFSGPMAPFNIDYIPAITLQFSVTEWNKLLTNYDLNPKNDKKVIADFTYSVQGQTAQLNSIGLKLKGNTSRRRPEGSTGEMHNSFNPDWHHCHFALDFSKNIPGQTFANRRKMDLKWFKDDAAYTREVYSYDLFRRYGIWTAPKASYCRVNIKVGTTTLANYGVYAMIEHIDEDYIAARYPQWTATIGDLWKAGYDNSGNNADFVQTSSIGIEDVALNPANSVYYAYDLKTNEANLPSAKANLIQFISDLNTKTGTEFRLWINSKMDIRLFMKTYAVNVMLGMWDDYWVNGNNFYFYFAGNGKAYFIPYDYDNTLGTSLLVSNSGTQNPLNWGSSVNRPLITKILAIPEYQQMYKDAISELINPNYDLFHSTKSIPRILKWQNRIAPYISNDTGEDMIIADSPASWGNQPNYRLISGNNQGGSNGPANWFTTRTTSIPW